MNAEGFKKLEAKVEHLLDLLIEAHAVAKLLRPMKTDESLIKRISKQQRGVGFDTIRHVLHWHLVLELVKIVADKSDKVPSIRTITDKLMKPEIKAALRTRYCNQMLVAIGDEKIAPTLLPQIRKGRKEKNGKEFDSLYSQTFEICTQLLNSPIVESMKTVRDQWLSHSELELVGGRYRFVDICSLSLKHGDEMTLLKDATEVFNGILALVKRASFDWDSRIAKFEHDAKDFWQP